MDKVKIYSYAMAKLTECGDNPDADMDELMLNCYENNNSTDTFYCALAYGKAKAYHDIMQFILEEEK